MCDNNLDIAALNFNVHDKKVKSLAIPRLLLHKMLGT